MLQCRMEQLAVTLENQNFITEIYKHLDTFRISNTFNIKV